MRPKPCNHLNRAHLKYTEMNLKNITLSEKPVMKGQKLCHSTYEVPRILKFIEKVRRMVVARGSGTRAMGTYCLM